MEIINVSPHSVRFQKADGTVYEVPPSGIVIDATIAEESAGKHASGVELVRTRFITNPTSEDALAKIEAEHPEAIIVGSLIAAQAYPGRVLALVPAQGFERVPPAEKRMRDDKFTTF